MTRPFRFLLPQLGVFLPLRESQAAEKPNVLFIAIDDMNDGIGPLGGHPQAKTPNLDRLAKRGVVFANAHCAAPLCNPPRAAVFSGKQPFETGVISNGVWKQIEAEGTRDWWLDKAGAWRDPRDSTTEKKP